MEQAHGQCYSAAGLRFENPRSGAIGMHFEIYTTGTIYNPQWTASSGTVFKFDGVTIPSIVDPDVASGATLYQGTEPFVATGQSWLQAQDSPIINNGGPSLNGPFERTDTYSGTLPDQIESAASALPNGGTVLIPGQGNYDLNRTVSLSLNGRDLSIATPRNVRFDCTGHGWTWEVTGDGNFGVYGGFWHGQNDTSKPGWLKTDVPNLDVSVNAVWFYPRGHGVHAEPRSKGRYRIFDTRTHNVAKNDGTASVYIGGSGCSNLLISNTHTTDTTCCYRFDSSISHMDAIKTPAHPWNNGAVFTDQNAPVDGTWYNIKWEFPSVDNTVVFDNADTSSPAAVVEPIVWSNNTTTELWRGKKPQFWPGTDVRVRQQWES
jgi:hypothetical protein